MCLLVMTTVDQMDASLNVLRSKSNKDEDLKILAWLTDLDYGPQHSDFLKGRQPGTGQWFLNSDGYRNWWGSNNTTLFCPGIPGAGKTIMAATVIDDLSARFLHEQYIAIAYIYCNFHRRHEQKLEDLLKALIKQLSLCLPSLPTHVKELYASHQSRNTRPSINELSKNLLQTAAMYARVFIVVDALDECEAADGTLSRFLSSIFSLQTASAISFLATSRPIPDIEKWFDGCASQEISATDGDICNYLNSHMARLPGFVVSNSMLQEEIKKEIIAAVDGMYEGPLPIHEYVLISVKVSTSTTPSRFSGLHEGTEGYSERSEKSPARIKCVRLRLCPGNGKNQGTGTACSGTGRTDYSMDYLCKEAARYPRTTAWVGSGSRPTLF